MALTITFKVMQMEPRTFRWTVLCTPLGRVLLVRANNGVSLGRCYGVGQCALTDEMGSTKSALMDDDGAARETPR